MKLKLDTGDYVLSLHVEELDKGVYGVGLDLSDEVEGARGDIIMTLDEAVAFRSLLGMVISKAQRGYPPTTDAPRSESAPQ